MTIVVLGRSITSSWGHGHAATYRALLRALARRGHEVIFLERDQPMHAAHRDMPHPAFCCMHLYASLDELAERFEHIIADADAVLVGSQVPEGIAVSELIQSLARGVRAFYDIDAPITLENLMRGRCTDLTLRQLRSYDLYLSATGGPTINHLEEFFQSPMARPLYRCAETDSETEEAQPQPPSFRWDLGFVGNAVADRLAPMDRLLLEPARRLPQGRFVVAGAHYPSDIDWPDNVQYIGHVPQQELAQLYRSQRFTLNLTQADKRVAGYSPSTRLFEAASCSTPIISDTWPGIDAFFTVGREILTATTTERVLHILKHTSQQQRSAITNAARERLLGEHTASRRAAELEAYLDLAGQMRRHRSHVRPARKLADG